jgi:hypothetical protein
MAWALEEILPRILNAGDAGLTLGKIQGKGGVAKQHHGKLAGTLKSLIEAKKIRGPLKHGSSQYYFASGRGPSAEVTSKAVSQLVFDSGTKLMSPAMLTKKITGLNGKFLPDGIKLAIENKTIVQLTFGRSKYYLHRDVAQKNFAFSDAAAVESPPPPRQPPGHLTLQAVRPVFQRLKAEQGGLGTIDIYDLMNALGVSKNTLHEFLLKEVKAGHLTIHPTTSVKLKPEVIDAGIRLPGFSEPFVTVALKDE